MKAIILAAGRSSRLRKIGFDIPKHLILINGNPYILYILNNLKKSNILEVGIVISRNDSITSKILGDGSGFGLKIKYIIQDDYRGTAMAIKSAQKFIGDKNFLVHLGSDVFENNFKKAIKIFEKNKSDAMILIHKEKDIHLHGMAVVENERVKRVVEKPQKPISKWALTGCYLFTKRIFDAINETPISTLNLNKNEVIVTDAIQKMIDSNLNVCAYKIKGWWGVLRTKETFEELNRFIDKKKE